MKSKKLMINRNVFGVGIILATTLLLSGCSFESIFAALSGTNEEQGARQAYEIGKVIEAKKTTIEKLKTQYKDYSELKNVSEKDNFIAVAYKKVETDKLTVAVEAYLPNPGRSFYEVWLKSNDGKKARVGAMEYKNTDDFSSLFTLDVKLASMSGIMLTRETVADETPETVIMTGAFSNQ